MWTDAARCQAGKMMVLIASTEPPKDHHDFEVFDLDGSEVLFDAARNEPPEELVLEVKGWRKERVAAYWDGLAFPV